MPNESVLSIADLNDLAARPQVAYEGYEDLRSAARRRNGGFTDPADIPRMREVIARRGAEWCQSVIGKPMFGGLESISTTDAGMLLVADERGLEPPVPSWLQRWKAQSAQSSARRDEIRAAGLERDQRRWAEVTAICGVEVEVRPNLHGRRYGSAPLGPLRHVVPAVDARSARRRHQAGRALCETAQRRKHLQLGEPTDEPATCVSCLAYTAEIRPADGDGH